MQDMLYAMLLWLGASTGYSVDVPLPNIALTESGNICATYGIIQKPNARRLVWSHITIVATLFNFHPASILMCLQIRRG